MIFMGCTGARLLHELHLIAIARRYVDMDDVLSAKLPVVRMANIARNFILPYPKLFAAAVPRDLPLPDVLGFEWYFRTSLPQARSGMCGAGACTCFVPCNIMQLPKRAFSSLPFALELQISLLCSHGRAAKSVAVCD